MNSIKYMRTYEKLKKKISFGSSTQESKIMEKLSSDKMEGTGGLEKKKMKTGHIVSWSNFHLTIKC